MISIKHLKKRFDGKIILKDIHLNIKKGEIVSIIGKSGSGKTTLLRILCILEKYDNGKIVFDNKKLNNGKTDLSTRRKISMVFQKPVALNMSVYDNVAYGLRLRKMKEDIIKKKVRSILKFVGIGKEFFDKNALTLSGGELQRVALARSIVISPLLLLLDEPTANLDDENTAKFEKLLMKINKEKKTTMIISTHNKAQAKRLGKSQYELKNGILQKVKL